MPKSIGKSFILPRSVINSLKKLGFIGSEVQANDIIGSLRSSTKNGDVEMPEKVIQKHFKGTSRLFVRLQNGCPKEVFIK